MTYENLSDGTDNDDDKSVFVYVSSPINQKQVRCLIQRRNDLQTILLTLSDDDK